MEIKGAKNRYWNGGNKLSLEDYIRHVTTEPFENLGVLEDVVETANTTRVMFSRLLEVLADRKTVSLDEIVYVVEGERQHDYEEVLDGTV